MPHPALPGDGSPSGVAIASECSRLRLEIEGAVQGVGFRPTVYRVARELGLAGWVRNDARGVLLEVEGPGPLVARFPDRLWRELPPRAVIDDVRTRPVAPRGDDRFEIVRSRDEGVATAFVLPDGATCPACLAELLDPADRRHRYPFTNCTHCGPRFTIVRGLPYDRPATTMANFPMCSACRAEYEDPPDRRFHAQPNACPRCGPQVELLESSGSRLARGDEAILLAAERIRDGAILALKGLGGFQLVVDAGNEPAVARLRARKGRPTKPFALMVADLDQARSLAEIDATAEGILTAPEAPIVLLPRLVDAPVAPAVAPGRDELGLMLPTSPLHHLLLGGIGRPIVATSGNLTDEPIATDGEDARLRLGRVADLLLDHDRPIARHADDSVVRVMAGQARLLRRARGWAPLPVRTITPSPAVLAVGCHLKNTVALGVGGRTFVGQHLGDMETPRAVAAFEAAVADFLDLWAAAPVALACDLHPGYVTTRWAEQAVADGHAGRVPALAGRPLVRVQHHHAHHAACLAENRHPGPALGVTWDGTGYGTDDTVWGGEVLFGDAGAFTRVARLRPFHLPGGEAAVREPWRVALALLWQVEGEAALDRDRLWDRLGTDRRGLGLVGQLLRREVRSPRTTSAGRLFDGVAALLGLVTRSTFEGEAAMALETAAGVIAADALPWALAFRPWSGGRWSAEVGEAPPPDGRLLEIDWRPTIAALFDGLESRRPTGELAAAFHATLAEVVGGVAVRAGEVTGAAAQSPVALSGGCFQNRRLLGASIARLGRDGREVILHQELPPNDGGISFGQVAVAAARLVHPSTESEDRPCV